MLYFFNVCVFFLFACGIMRYAHSFTDKNFAKAPRTPHYGINAKDKHWFVRTQGEVWLNDTQNREDFTDWEHVRRLETLLRYFVFLYFTVICPHK